MSSLQHPILSASSRLDGGAALPRRERLLAGVFGAVVLTGLALGICAFYMTIPGSSIGRANDFLIEAYPSLVALAHGHLTEFLHIAPAYVGSFLVRAPWALGVIDAHGSWQAVYAASALPCVLAPPILATWLAHIYATDRARAVQRLWLWLSPFGLLLLIDPIFVNTIILGHPEDILGACLCIAGVVQAARGRAYAAAILLGLAVANKTWALVALPVGLAVAPRLPWRALLIGTILMVAPYLPVLLTSQAQGASLGSATGDIFFAPQLWYWFGPRFWGSVHAHQIIVVVAFAGGAAYRLHRSRRLAGGRDPIREALLLLALVLLLRAALDPWDNQYYQLPFLLTVYAIEFGRPPRWSLLVTLAMTFAIVPLFFFVETISTRALGYQMVVVPMIVVLLLRVFLSPPAWAHLRARSSAQLRLGRSG